MKSSGLIVGAVVLGMLAAGCSGDPPLTAALKRGDPKACVHVSVLDTMVRIVDDIRDSGDTFTTVPEGEFRDGLTYIVDSRSVTLAGYDETTDRVTCQGNMIFTVGSEAVEQPVLYSIIPTADGSDQRIALENHGAIAAHMASERETFIEAFDARWEQQRDENWVDPAVRLNGVIQGK